MTYPTDYADPYGVYPIDLDPSDLLKPCPFCGRVVEKIKSEYFRDNERLVLACSCGCRMVGREVDPYCCTPDEWKNLEKELIEAWNRRTKDELRKF